MKRPACDFYFLEIQYSFSFLFMNVCYRVYHDYRVLGQPILISSVFLLLHPPIISNGSTYYDLEILKVIRSKGTIYFNIFITLQRKTLIVTPTVATGDGRRHSVYLQNTRVLVKLPTGPPPRQPGHFTTIPPGTGYLHAETRNTFRLFHL